MWYIVVCNGSLSAVPANIYPDHPSQVALRQSGIARIGSKTTHRETRALLQIFAWRCRWEIRLLRARAARPRNDSAIMKLEP